MSQFAILGIGEFGITVAHDLSKAGHAVLCVDADRERVQLASEWAARAVVADVVDRAALESLALDEFDAVVIGIGENLEASILATLFARELGAKRIVAKASTRAQGRILERMGVMAEDVVAPEHEIGSRLAARLIRPNVVDYLPLEPGISVREVKPPEEFLGKSISELEVRQRFKVEVVAIRDASMDSVSIPASPTLKLEGKDRLFLIGRDEDLDRLGGAS
jgi:trk system potassium uptake protein TrkA